MELAQYGSAEIHLGGVILAMEEEGDWPRAAGFVDYPYLHELCVTIC